MPNKTIIEEDLILLGFSAKNKEELLTALSQRLLEKGYVVPDYTDAVLAREKQYPTGLQIGPIGVAIPHTDSKYVKQTKIAVCVPDQPVTFELMGEDSGTVDADMVFLLAINNSEDHLKFLQQLMAVFQNQPLLSQLKETKDKQNFVKVLGENL
ncbi:PTS sugar transporter subunit IIA [Paenactinomyces guangxiensis]|uniref:PTS sugar transporter subunit IIA n=1 Tax=Paenactinomyces guangxiensis TaxID=1490290 RepID=A0A7W1WUQ5_9BACL|nr:PTS sugar transporter subunit IIA [Paenactinomyces guangxiensis]MBA4496357.1 PTS sugar transporter subunit IIA [Paenactinomyces guangxiensis]MBH8593610.1 PTS sugar transporter subunit IIA [Paenactinomyces guangxiensis]